MRKTRSLASRSEHEKQSREVETVTHAVRKMKQDGRCDAMGGGVPFRQGGKAFLGK